MEEEVNKDINVVSNKDKKKKFFSILLIIIIVTLVIVFSIKYNEKNKIKKEIDADSQLIAHLESLYDKDAVSDPQTEKIDRSSAEYLSSLSKTTKKNNSKIEDNSDSEEYLSSLFE